MIHKHFPHLTYKPSRRVIYNPLDESQPGLIISILCNVFNPAQSIHFYGNSLRGMEWQAGTGRKTIQRLIDLRKEYCLIDWMKGQ